MTKNVRIENADTSNYKVRVRTFDKNSVGPDILVSEEILAYPTAMSNPNLYITSSRYIVVDELPE